MTNSQICSDTLTYHNFKQQNTNYLSDNFKTFAVREQGKWVSPSTQLGGLKLTPSYFGRQFSNILFRQHSHCM